MKWLNKSRLDKYLLNLVAMNDNSKSTWGLNLMSWKICLFLPLGTVAVVERRGNNGTVLQEWGFLLSLLIVQYWVKEAWAGLNGNGPDVSSVAESCPIFCNPMDCSTPSLPVLHQLLESTQTHVHWVGDAIQPSHPLSSPSPPDFNLSQHQGLFKWVSSSHLAKVLEFQLQHHSFQWILRTDFL